MENLTLVQYHGERSGYSCGYCNQPFGKLSHGMSTQTMDTVVYQKLIDRGWRRSGKYCYKPVMDRTCCPQYTIRCRVLEFRLSKSQKKVLKRMKRFLASEGNAEIEKWRTKCDVKKDEQINNITNPNDMGNAIDLAVSTSINKEGSSSVEKPMMPPSKKSKLGKCNEKSAAEVVQKKADSCGNSKKRTDTCQKGLHDMLPHFTSSDGSGKKLELRTIRAQLGDSDFEATRAESHAVYQKYQHVIHGDPPERSEGQWIRFLVSCSLNRDNDGPGPGYGNYHQHYVLDGKIIAVGVIDILPNCVSSVYFYYDPDYGFLSLGVYSALSEIAYSQQLYQESSILQYYYMGFYIHNCPKMRYKGNYTPSDLLCPESYQWVPIESCLPLLDKKKYARLADSSVVSQDVQCVVDFDYNDLGVIYVQSLMKYDSYKSIRYFALDIDEETASDNEKRLLESQKRTLSIEMKKLKEYVSLVGTECAKQMYLFRQD